MMFQDVTSSRRAIFAATALLASFALVACGDSSERFALGQNLEVQEGETLSIVLDGSGGAVEIVDAPQHGTLEGTGRELTYVPDAGFLGRDTFTFTLGSSEPATIQIDVFHTPFYAFTRGSSEMSSKLYRVERGAHQLVGDIGHALGGIKFDPTDGKLFGTTRGSDFEDKCDLCLVTVNTSTGAATVVGPLHYEVDDLVGQAVPTLAFTSDGALYGWSEDGDDLVSIDKATSLVEVLGDSGIGSWAHGMWVDADDTIWFINGDGYVYTVDPVTGATSEIHTGEALAESAGLDYDGDFQVRGDVNPVNEIYWGVSPASGESLVNPYIRVSIDADTAEYVGAAAIAPVPSLHGLAFPR